jgi:hypothetical protein
MGDKTNWEQLVNTDGMVRIPTKSVRPSEEREIK